MKPAMHTTISCVSLLLGACCTDLAIDGDGPSPLPERTTLADFDRVTSVTELRAPPPDPWTELDAVHDAIMARVDEQGLRAEDLQALLESNAGGCEAIDIPAEECAALYERARSAIDEIEARLDAGGNEPPWGLDPRLSRPSSCGRGYGSCLLAAAVGALYTGPHGFPVAYAAFAMGCYCSMCTGGYTRYVCW